MAIGNHSGSPHDGGYDNSADADSTDPGNGAVRDYNEAIGNGASHTEAIGIAMGLNHANMGNHNSDGPSGLNNDGSASNGLLNTTQHQKEVDSANALKDTIWTTKHGSQGVDNKAYEEYMKRYPDLMADYEKNWGKDGALAQNGEAITRAEYGAMHYWEYGKKEGRSLTGPSGGGGGGGGGDTPNPKPKPPIDEGVVHTGPTNEQIGGTTYDGMYDWYNNGGAGVSDGNGGTMPIHPNMNPDVWLDQSPPVTWTDPGTYINPNIPGNQAQSSQQQASMPVASGGGLLDQMNQTEQGLLMNLELQNLLGG